MSLNIVYIYLLIERHQVLLCNAAGDLPATGDH